MQHIKRHGCRLALLFKGWVSSTRLQAEAHNVELRDLRGKMFVPSNFFISVEHTNLQSRNTEYDTVSDTSTLKSVQT